jgi:hypothetical protein
MKDGTKDSSFYYGLYLYLVFCYFISFFFFGIRNWWT